MCSTINFVNEFGFEQPVGLDGLLTQESRPWMNGGGWDEVDVGGYALACLAPKW